MDTATQILLTVMIVVLGITLTLIGVQLFFVLKELQSSIRRLNFILENAQKISQNVTSGTERVSQLISGLTHGTTESKSKAGSIISALATLLAARTVFQKFKKGNEEASK